MPGLGVKNYKQKIWWGNHMASGKSNRRITQGGMGALTFHSSVAEDSTFLGYDFMPMGN